MAGGPLRGLEAKHEYHDQLFLRDLRGFGAKVRDGLSDPVMLAGLLVMLAVLGFAYPVIVDLTFVIGVLLFVWALRQPAVVPLRLPAQCGLPDPSDPHPAHGRPQKASGIVYLGTERATGKQLYISNDDMRRHMILAGTTGGGKSEFLLSLVANALSWGSGFIYIDGKADRKLFAQICSMARRTGRDDDVLLVNFITGAKDLVGVKDASVRSNTLNPFAFGSSGMIIQMLVSLMSESSGDGQQWKDMAIAMMSCGIRALVFLRDKGELVLSVKVIRDYLTLDKYLELYHRRDLPESIRGDLKAFLVGLPGLSEDLLEIDLEQLKAAKRMPKRQGTQAPEVPAKTYEQFGYRAMQFSRLLDSLASDYGHIFNVPFGDVDFWDVVVNRRILVVLLPALEKSSTELANLGKVVVANLKAMMAMAMGDEIEGSWQNLVDKRVTTAPSPIITVFDEAGYYIVDGMAVMAAQARSLGFGLVFGTQDIPSLHRNADKEPDSIIANCNTKIAMKVEDPGKTWELFKNSAGEAKAISIDGYEGETGTFGGQAYRDGNRAKIENVNRVSLRDLQEQGAGDFHLISEGRVVRGKAFYAAPEATVDLKALHIGPHHLIRVAPPSSPTKDTGKTPTSLADRLLQSDFAAKVAAEARKAPLDGPLRSAALSMRNAIGGGRSAMEASCIAIASLVQQKNQHDDALLAAAQIRQQTADAVRRKKSENPIGAVLEGCLDTEGTEQAFDGGALRTTEPSAQHFETALERQTERPLAEQSTTEDQENEQDAQSNTTDELLMLSGLLDHPHSGEKSPPILEPIRHGISVDGTFVEMSRAVSGNATLMDALAHIGAREKTQTVHYNQINGDEEGEGEGEAGDLINQMLEKLYES
jgi:intracellular multiplication protein IcmO